MKIYMVTISGLCINEFLCFAKKQDADDYISKMQIIQDKRKELRNIIDIETKKFMTLNPMKEIISQKYFFKDDYYYESPSPIEFGGEATNHNQDVFNRKRELINNLCEKFIKSNNLPSNFNYESRNINYSIIEFEVNSGELL